MVHAGGVRPYTAQVSLGHLRKLFRNRLISLNTNHSWVLYSPDLNLLDFWFWGAANGKVYANRPERLVGLKQNAAAYAPEVTAKTWKKIGQNFCVRVKHVSTETGLIWSMWNIRTLFDFQTYSNLFNFMHLAYLDCY